MSQLKQSLVHGGLWSAGGRVFAIGAAFVLNLVLARSLSPEDYAVYFVVMSAMIILATVGGLGMDRVVVRLGAAHEALGFRGGVASAILRCLVAVTLGTAAVCAVFYLCTPWLFTRVVQMPAAVGLAGLMALWLLVSSIQRQLAESFRGLNDIRSATLFGGFRNNGILVSLLTCAGTLLLWWSGRMTLVAAVLCTVLASTLVVVIAGLSLARRLAPYQKQDDADAQGPQPRVSILEALREGWPLWLASLLAVLRAQAHGWFAAGFDSADQVALFAIAQRFALLMTAPLTIVNALLPPVVASLYARGETARLERVVQAVGGIAAIPCIAVVVLILLAGRGGLGFLFGTHYEAAFPLLVILCMGQLANMVTGAWQVVLPMTGLGRQTLQVSIAAAAVQFLASVVGGYYAGVMGVAVGASLGFVAGNVLGVLVARKYLGIWTLISVRRSVLAEVMVLLRQRMARLLPARMRGPT
jgi:O-antigen/teichoic acid export membrane protein